MSVKLPFVLFVLLFFSCNSECIKNGYQDKISYLPSENIELYLNGVETKDIVLPLLDINGNEVDKISVSISPQKEEERNYWWKNGYGYAKTGSYNPKKLKSGIYNFENSSPFIIKNPLKKNDVLIVYPSNTDNAYNEAGGRSSYTKPIGEKLNFRRPVNFHKFAKPFFKWINLQYFQCDYICDRDLDDFDNLKNYKVIVIPGHNEYWTRKARRNFDRFVDDGGAAVILSGNTMWWQVRYENDKMVCHKNNSDSLVSDSLKTIGWNSSLLNYAIISSIGADFDHGGFGVKNDKGWNGYKILANSPLFNQTGIKEGDVLSVPTVEFDSSPLVIKDDKLMLDTNMLNPYKFNLLGYDRVTKKGDAYGTMIVYQKHEKSGVIINTCSTNWCSDGFAGKDGEKIKKLTYNFLDFLLNDKNVFI